MSISDLWPLAIEAWEALGAGYGPVMARTAAKEAGFPEGAYFGWILPALGLDPDPISARQLAAWSPYTALALNESRLAASARLGFLRDAGGGNYYLTDRRTDVSHTHYVRGLRLHGAATTRAGRRSEPPRLPFAPAGGCLPCRAGAARKVAPATLSPHRSGRGRAHRRAHRPVPHRPQCLPKRRQPGGLAALRRVRCNVGGLHLPLARRRPHARRAMRQAVIPRPPAR